MRTNDVLLDGFEEIKILQQYLYMSEEHFIEIENSIGVHLQIRMRENLHYYCKNMNFLIYLTCAGAIICTLRLC